MNATRPVDRTLLASGFALFLVGLFVGLASPSLANPRAGLASHLGGGVMNGMFLVLVALGERASTVTRWLLLVGTWINLVGTFVSAVFGTSRMTPIAGAGHTGPEWAELLVMVCLGLTVPTMVPALGLLLWGALGSARRPGQPLQGEPPTELDPHAKPFHERLHPADRQFQARVGAPSSSIAAQRGSCFHSHVSPTGV